MKRSLLALVASILFACGVVGPEGPQGPRGPVGPAGSFAGPGSRSCGEQVGNSFLEYYWVRDATGAAFVSCAISDLARTYSKVEVWASGTVGAANGMCMVVWDADSTMDGGYWAFGTANNVTTAKLMDPTSPYNGTVFQFATTSCIQR